MNVRRLAHVLRYKTGTEVRYNQIGYTQRGHEPTAQDAAFAFESAHMAVELLKQGIGNEVIGMRHGRVFHMPIEKALPTKPKFKKDIYRLINSL